MNLCLPKAMLIDLDDTILDDSSNVNSAWEEACKLADLPQQPLLSTVHEVRDWYWSDAARHREGRADLRAASARIVDIALERLGHRQDGLARRISDRYRDLREEGIVPLPGAVETLQELQDRNIALALVTNGAGALQRTKIERFNLAGYFGHIQIEGEFGLGKPAPEVYQATMRVMGVAPQESWFVGDNLEFDVAAPQVLGLKGVWVDRAGMGVPVGSSALPDAIIGGLPDLRRLLPPDAKA